MKFILLEKIDIYTGIAKLPSKNGSLTAAPDEFSKSKTLGDGEIFYSGILEGLSGKIYVSFHVDVNGF